MRIVAPDDPAWRYAYGRLPTGRRDVFYAPGFAKACAAGLYREDRVRCAIHDEPDGVILYPFVERDLAPMLPWSNTATSLRDATGLYGRGGVVHSECLEHGLQGFHDDLGGYFEQRHVITSFDRYHPTLQNERAAANDTEVRQTGEFVVVNLRPDMGTIEAGYKGKQRNSLRKSERAGVTTDFDPDCRTLETFLSIHQATMQRQGADQFYYFDRAFYETLVKELPDNILLANALFEGDIVSSDLILYEAPFAHLFLSGTRPDHLDKSPNTKLKHETFRYLKDLGIEHYLLGGGHGPTDGVYKYKRSFAPDDCVPSNIGCTIHAETAYRQLRAEFIEHSGICENQRFQFYDVA